MTYEKALRHLDRVSDYLNNLLDTQHRLSNEEIESLISDVDAVQEGLQQGLTQTQPLPPLTADQKRLEIALRSLINAWNDPGPMGTMYEMPRAVSYAKSVLGETGYGHAN